MPDGNSPLNMGAPWAALSNPPGGDNYAQQLQGVLSPESSRLGPTPRRIPGEEELNAALGSLRDMQSRLMVTQAAAAVPSPPDEISMKTDPKTGQRTVNVKTSAENYENTTRSAMNWHQALGGMQQQLEQEVSKLKQREEQVRSQPWMQLATALSANLAQAKDMPGWVQAAGRTAAQLNPTADELRNQRLAVLGKEAEITEKSAALGEASLRTGIERERLGIEQKREDRLVTDEARKAAEDKMRDLRDTRDKFLVAAEKGDAPPAEVLNKLFQEKTDPKTAASLADAITKTNEAARARIKVETDLKARHETAFEKAIAGKGSDKEEVTAARKALAQSFAAGDLASVRDVASMRGPDRMLLFADIKKIDPKFDMAEMNRKIDTMKSFTVGKDGVSIQSFDTFLQHAGELKDTLDGLYQSSSPALNKPLNWIRKNAEGNPEYQRLLVALEPVGKEFESFLLNQRALYIEDRKQIKELMDGNSGPKQIMSALKQMGKTAKDRYTAMNQRYKRVMKQDIEDPFSGEAKIGADKIGIDIGAKPTPEAGGTVNVTKEELKKMGFQ